MDAELLDLPTLLVDPVDVSDAALLDEVLPPLGRGYRDDLALGVDLLLLLVEVLSQDLLGPLLGLYALPFSFLGKDS